MESIYGADYTNYDPKDEEHWYSVANGQLDGDIITILHIRKVSM